MMSHRGGGTGERLHFIYGGVGAPAPRTENESCPSKSSGRKLIGRVNE